MITDFKRPGPTHRTIQIHHEKVEVVPFVLSHFGTIFEDTLKWDTEAITNKRHQRLHLLRKPRSVNVDPTNLKLFYNSFIENVLTFPFVYWFYNLNAKQRSSLQRIVNISSKIICDQVRTLFLFCDQQILHRVRSVLKDPEHALFQRLPHGRQFRPLAHRTNRRGNCCVPTAVRLLSKE